MIMGNRFNLLKRMGHCHSQLLKRRGLKVKVGTMGMRYMRLRRDRKEEKGMRPLKTMNMILRL
jgi:hypothetical protein